MKTLGFRETPRTGCRPCNATSRAKRAGLLEGDDDAAPSLPAWMAPVRRLAIRSLRPIELHIHLVRARRQAHAARVRDNIEGMDAAWGNIGRKGSRGEGRARIGIGGPDPLVRGDLNDLPLNRLKAAVVPDMNGRHSVIGDLHGDAQLDGALGHSALLSDDHLHPDRRRVV